MVKIGQTWMCSSVPSNWKGLIHTEELVKVTDLVSGDVIFDYLADGGSASCTMTKFLAHFVKWAD